MKALDAIRVGAYRFRREYRKTVRETPRGKPLDGLFIPKEQLILIRAGLSPDRERVMRLHESIHAALWGRDDLELPDDVEERVALALSEGLAAIYPDYDF